jgi:nicotinamide-nucleotide amidase
MPDSNVEQATVPENSKIIWNDNGTAPGLWMEKNDSVFVALPGVPFEMKTMIDKTILSMLQNRFASKINYVLKSRSVYSTGISESSLHELIGDVNEFTGENKLAFLPSAKGVRIRIDVTAENEESAREKINFIESELKKRAGKYIYGSGDDLLEKIIGELLIKKGYSLSTAESCSGGLLSSMITDVSGSSRYYAGGICSYSNEIKINILNVSNKTIDKFGAVSEQTAIEMAYGIRNVSNTNIGISITGIAGPEGGTKEKPVGLVWIGYSDDTKTFARKFIFSSIRERNKIRAVQMALQILRKELI